MNFSEIPFLANLGLIGAREPQAFDSPPPADGDFLEQFLRLLFGVDQGFDFQNIGAEDQTAHQAAAQAPGSLLRSQVVEGAQSGQAIGLFSFDVLNADPAGNQKTTGDLATHEVLDGPVKSTDNTLPGAPKETSFVPQSPFPQMAQDSQVQPQQPAASDQQVLDSLNQLSETGSDRAALNPIPPDPLFRAAAGGVGSEQGHLAPNTTLKSEGVASGATSPAQAVPDSLLPSSGVSLLDLSRLRLPQSFPENSSGSVDPPNHKPRIPDSMRGWGGVDRLQPQPNVQPDLEAEHVVLWREGEVSRVLPAVAGFRTQGLEVLSPPANRIDLERISARQAGDDRQQETQQDLSDQRFHSRSQPRQDLPFDRSDSDSYSLIARSQGKPEIEVGIRNPSQPLLIHGQVTISGGQPDRISVVSAVAELQADAGGRFLTDDAVDQILERFIAHSRLERSGESFRFEVRLKPEFLGRLQIQTTLNEEGLLRAQIQVEDASVRAAVEARLPALLERFQESGLRIESLEVQDLVDDSNERAAQDKTRQQEQRRGGRNSSSSAEAEESLAKEQSKGWKNGFHYFA